MPWAPIAAAAISAIGSGMAADKNSSAQRRASEAAMRQQQAELDFRKSLYDEYKQKYGPLEDEVLRSMRGPNPIGWGLVSGKINKGYADATRKMEQSMGGRMLPQGVRRGLLLSKNEALGGAYQKGLLDKMNTQVNLARSSPVLGLAGGYAGGLGRMGDIFQRESDRYGALSANGWSSAARSLGTAANMWAMDKYRADREDPGDQTTLDMSPIDSIQTRDFEMPSLMMPERVPFQYEDMQSMPLGTQDNYTDFSQFGLSGQPYETPGYVPDYIGGD